jgi:transcription elongation GreA/GreB family factor
MVNAMETMQPTATAEQRAPQPARESAPTLLTRAGERALRHEAEELRWECDVEIPRRLRELADSNSDRDRSARESLRAERGALLARVDGLDELLAGATVVDQPDRPEQVRINSEVTLRIGERTLVRTLDTGSGAAGTVSVVSPIGRAILGREVGTTVPVHLPDGRTRTVELVAVERALSPA